MGIFDKWILKRAEKLQAAEKAKRDEESKKANDKWEAYRKLKKDAYEAIMELINEKAAEMEQTPCHIEVGQTAILNIYSLGRNGNNGWDGGPRSLLNNLKSIKEPVTVKITKIYVDTSLADEIMSKYLDNHSEERLRQLMERGAIKGDYQVWLGIRNRSNNKLGDEYGLYRTAHFDTDDEFKPKWGLNVDSFLPFGSVEYQETYNVWSQEIDLYKNREMLDLRIKELEQQKREIDEKYKGLKYAN